MPSWALVVAMLERQLQRFPVRPRALVLQYARPCLLEWILGREVVEATHEPHFDLVTSVQIGHDGGILLSQLPFSACPIRHWAVVIDPFIYVGIVGRGWPEGKKDETSTWIEIRQHVISDQWCYAWTAMNADYTDRRVIGNRVPKAIRSNRLARFDLWVDLSCNILTAVFDGHTLATLVPNLSTYRPYLYFATRSNDTPARFLDPSDE